MKIDDKASAVLKRLCISQLAFLADFGFLSPKMLRCDASKQPATKDNPYCANFINISLATLKSIFPKKRASLEYHKIFSEAAFLVISFHPWKCFKARLQIFWIWCYPRVVIMRISVNSVEFVIRVLIVSVYDSNCFTRYLLSSCGRAHWSDFWP